jgi:hypothetical protein
MRIALCGTTNQNIVGFVNDFLKKYPLYKKSKNSFNQVLEKKNIKISNNISQNIILNTLIDELIETPKDSNVIFDVSLLDNLVLSMWLNTQGITSDQFINTSLALIKQSLHFYDIIFYFPNIAKYTPKNELLDTVTDSTMKENLLNNESFYLETGNFYAAIYDLYLAGNEKLFEFSAIDGCPAMIEIFGTPEERILQTALYLDKNGQPLGKSPTDTLLTLPTLEEQIEIDKIRALNNK